MSLATLLSPLAPVVQAVRGGTDRWDIKTGTDIDAPGIALQPMPSSIAELSALPPPLFPRTRTQMERMVVQIPCVITLWKIEADGDHHLVLADGQGNTMIAEIPDPACVRGPSPWIEQITGSFTAFNARPLINRPVTVTGVVFFDHLHGQTGVARNGVEVHPIFSISPGDTDATV